VKKVSLFIMLIGLTLRIWAGGTAENPAEMNAKTELITVTDALGRQVQVPHDPRYIICSGPGALRLAVYLQAEERVIAVDDIEGRRSAFDARPYAMVHPRFRELPVFGEFRGHDNPELILSLDPQPQVIFKTYYTMGYDPLELEKKTGIPVVTLNYGDLVAQRADLDQSLRTMASVLHKEARAEEIISFIDATIDDLKDRALSVPDEQRISCYVGGIASKGPHGIQSTEPAYPPFLFTNARNVAFDPEKPLKEQQHVDIAKEQIIDWNPELIFIDVATLQSGEASGALYELTHEQVFSGMQAVKKQNIYGVLPYNWYTQNFGSVLADAYYVGSILYPKAFGDIDPARKADEIYTFLVGGPVFSALNASFDGLIFTRITK